MSAERSGRDREVLVERFAAHFESRGYSRISGRMVGHFLTSAEPHLSLTQVATDLGVSKASVSTNARVLIAQRLLTTVPVPGSREAHYVVLPDGVQQAFTEIAAAAAAMVSLAEEGLQLCSGTVTPGVIALRSITDVYGRIHAMFAAETALSEAER